MGVYVAKSFVAYSTALVAFTSKAGPCIMHGDFSLDKDLVPPVVLNIRLQESCTLTADEDYLRLEPKLRKKNVRVATKGI